MPLKDFVLTNDDRLFAEAVHTLGYCNPFLPERIEAERQALGDAFTAEGADWNRALPGAAPLPNVEAILARIEQLLDPGETGSGSQLAHADAETRRLYGGLVLFHRFHRYSDSFDRLIDAKGGMPGLRPLWQRFRDDLESALYFRGEPLLPDFNTAHLFACFFQIRRAYRHIFQLLVGRSGAMVRLRAALWESVFTHRMDRYRRMLYHKMRDMPSLITGPSGTGKELAARAIFLSRYLPFDPVAVTFAEDHREGFHALNLSALSPTLIESELFGHRKGAFTGAFADRAGWLESCSEHGVVFLDEIGEVDPAVQVKLLRVLQERVFQRIGDTQPRRFHGKLIAATHRDLAAAVTKGSFREDFYYRLCADQITTPTLLEQLQGNIPELEHLLAFIVRRVLGEEAPEATREIIQAVGLQLGDHYSWPGNFRELEQCVRNLLIRGEYRPLHSPAPGIPTASAAEADPTLRAIARGDLTLDAVQRYYCQSVHARTGNYAATAQRLGVNWRTVKKHLTPLN